MSLGVRPFVPVGRGFLWSSQRPFRWGDCPSINMNGHLGYPCPLWSRLGGPTVISSADFLGGPLSFVFISISHFWSFLVPLSLRHSQCDRPIPLLRIFFPRPYFKFLRTLLLCSLVFCVRPSSWVAFNVPDGIMHRYIVYFSAACFLQAGAFDFTTWAFPTCQGSCGCL